MNKLNLFVLALCALAATASFGATPLQVGQTANPTGAIGVPYSFSGVVAVNGGTTPYSFSVTAGTVPPGLTFKNNTISGTPTATATPFNFTVTVTDSGTPKQTGSAPVTLNVFPSGSVVITTGSLPAATIGVAYSQTLQAIDGITPYTWALRGNSTLPAGLKLNGNTISGTPTAQAMTTSFTIQVTDSSNNPPQNTAQMPLTIAVQTPLKITTTSLPGAMVGSAYSAPLNATGGTTPYTWSIASGSSAPGGLTLSSTGQLSGTPTTASGSLATTFKVQVRDSSKTVQTATATLSLQIAPDPLVITTNALKSGVVGTAFSGSLASTGGTGSVTWKLASGSTLVAGLGLSSSGVVSGTPTASTGGHSSFTVVATDSARPAHTATRAINYIINASNGGFKVTTNNLASGYQNISYSTQLASTGGTGKVTWMAISGSNAQGLPTGLSLSSSGLISGVPTVLGNFAFWVQAKDSSTTPKTVTAYLDIIINALPAPTITGLNPSSATAGGAGFQMTITGNNFTSTAVVKWNSTTLVSSYSSPTQLTATVPGSAIATAGSATVTVKTAAGTSTGATFTIDPAVPKCTADGSGNAKLKGNYALQISQIRLDDNGWQDFMLGAFTADGKGNFTGIFDINSPYSSKGDQNGSITGTYSVGSDNRGALSVSVPQGSGAKQIIDYCIALDSISNGIAGSGRMIENYTNMGVGSGAFYGQGGSNFTVSSAQGSWVFGAQGGVESSEGQVGRVAVAGYLTLDGSGKLTDGQTDVSLDQYNSGVLGNTFIHQTGLNGSYTLDSSTGRGTITAIVPGDQGGGGTSHLVFYIAGPNQVLLMNADPGGGGEEDSGPVTAGKAYRRTTGTFNNATLSGPSVYIANAISDTNSTGYNQRKIEAGIFTWNGNGSLTGNSDVNNAGTVTQYPNNPFRASYSVDANGRVTIPGSSSGPNFYLVGPNQGYGTGGGLKATLIYFENQTVPSGGFKLSSFDGSYSLGTVWYGFPQQNAVSGVGTANGTGSVVGTIDLNKDGDVSVDMGYDNTYTAATTGRFVFTNAPSSAFYMVSPTKAYMIDISGKQWEPLAVFNHQ